MVRKLVEKSFVRLGRGIREAQTRSVPRHVLYTNSLNFLQLGQGSFNIEDIRLALQTMNLILHQSLPHRQRTNQTIRHHIEVSWLSVSKSP